MKSSRLILAIFLFIFLLSEISVSAQKKYKAYIVSNAHFDTQWCWDVQKSINEYLLNTMDQNFLLLESYPDYIFNFEGGIKYSWMKEYYPERYERVKEYIRQGRWHVSGSSWDATDPNLPSPESFFRNILLGQEFYRKEFGVQSKDIFLPDCFGFGYTLPTIAAHAGLIGFSTQKLQWRYKPFYGNSKVPFNIGLWKGVDGSVIMAALNAQNYNFSWDRKDLSKDQGIRELARQGINNTAYRYYGTGDIGGSPTIGSVISIEKGLRGKGDIQIISATSDQLYQDYLPFYNHPELPVFDGELLMDVHATGCYTSQAAMKQFNRKNEELAVAAEKSSVAAHYLTGTVYPSQEIDESWKRFIWHQFHDDLTGTSIPEAYRFSWNDELISQSCFADVITSSVGNVAKAMNTLTNGIPIVVYNSLSSNNRGIVRARISMANPPEQIRVVNPEGKEVPAQLTGYSNETAEIAFSAEVAPTGYAVYDIYSSENNVQSRLKISGNSLENRIYKLTLDTNGDISSLIDKRYNKELVAPGKAFRLALFTENNSFAWPSWEIQKSTIDATPVAISDSVSIVIAENGPACASLCVKRRFGDSHFIQYIRMTDGAADDRIDIVNEVDWATTNALLKAEFPMAVCNPQATYDLGLGQIKRGNNSETAYEVYAQQWADITDNEGYGISILNNCKYGWDKPADNILRLTLLHAPNVKNNFTYQAQQDMGHHTFTYSIVGHSNEPQLASIPHKSDELNNPLLAFQSPRHEGPLGRRYSFLKISNPQIAVKALKKAQEGEQYIIRLYETQGKEAKDVEIEFPSSIIDAAEMNGVEKEIGKATIKENRLIFSTTAFAPKTFAIRLKKCEINLPAVHHTQVQLPYNHQAFTTDASFKQGEFDKEGCSFAAELLRNGIISLGIPFKIGNSEENNVLKCHGNIIELPKDQKYKKVYILATSTEGEVKADFRLGNKVFTREVPYYSGFYGQWGKTGFSRSYIRDLPLAYIGTHRHNPKCGNEAYAFTYIYRICLELPEGTTQLQLPDDDRVAVFAITVSDNPADDIKAATPLISTLADSSME